MKKIKAGILLVSLLAISLLAVSVIAMAEGAGASMRYFVKSDSGMLKAVLGVTHNFDNGFTTELTAGQLKALQRLGAGLGIEIEEVPQYHILGKPAPAARSCTPSSQMPWGIVKVNGGSGGAGVNVAVLDTGVYTRHLDLNVKLCKDTTKRGVVNGCSDGNGHGTHVAGTIAANGGSDGRGIFGVAPEANLWAIKVCGASGCWADDIAVGIKYVADQGANVISMSLGGNAESSLIRDAVDYAAGKGALVIAAAGNDGPAEGSIDYPGANVKVVAVGAIDANEAVPDWSSRGVNDGDFVIEEREVELGAPGVNTESTWKDGCYRVMSGTSMATPHVAGLAAKLWQGNAADTRNYLQSLAVNHDLHTAGDDSATGFGLPIAP